MESRLLRIFGLSGLVLLLLLFSRPIHSDLFAQDTKKETKTDNKDIVQQTKTVPEKELSEISKLKAENHQLKIQVTQCQVNLLDAQSKIASTQLSSEQLELEKAFRDEIKPDKDSKFNWSTLKFDSPIKK